MFGKQAEKKKRGSFLPFVIVRLLLSLIIFAIFGLGIYQAFRTFSGYDPLQVDPKTLVLSVLTSQESEKLVTSILGVSFFQSIQTLTQNIKNSTNVNQAGNYTVNTVLSIKEPLSFKFALVADSHSDNINLKKALERSKELGVKFVVGLGDYSNVGTKDELAAAKEVFERSGLPYYTTVGDHDLWDSRNRGLNPLQNFSEILGPAYQSFGVMGVRFLMLYDSDNDVGIDSIQWEWLESALAEVAADKPKLFFILTHKPLFHPSSDHFMGKGNQVVSSQAQNLMNILKNAGVNEIFAGDTHFYTRYEESQTGLKMTTLGALTSERNAQTPRFAIVDVYQDGSYNVQDLEVTR